MNDHQHFQPSDNPTLAPCRYVEVESPNPLPIAGAWDEESVGSYSFPEWLEADEVEVPDCGAVAKAAAVGGAARYPHHHSHGLLAGHPHHAASAYGSSGDDCSTIYTADTNDDEHSTGSDGHSLVVLRRTLRRRSSSSSSLSLSSAPPVMQKARTRTRLTPAAAASFLRDRVHTFTNNMEVLATLPANSLGVGSALGVVGEEEAATNQDLLQQEALNYLDTQELQEQQQQQQQQEGSSSDDESGASRGSAGSSSDYDVNAANPLARFVQARMNTFSSNVEMMSSVLSEQIESYLAATEEDTDDFYTYHEESDW